MVNSFIMVQNYITHFSIFRFCNSAAINKLQNVFSFSFNFVHLCGKRLPWQQLCKITAFHNPCVENHAESSGEKFLDMSIFKRVTSKSLYGGL